MVVVLGAKKNIHSENLEAAFDLGSDPRGTYLSRWWIDSNAITDVPLQPSMLHNILTLVWGKDNV